MYNGSKWQLNAIHPRRFPFKAFGLLSTQFRFIIAYMLCYANNQFGPILKGLLRQNNRIIAGLLLVATFVPLQRSLCLHLLEQNKSAHSKTNRQLLYSNAIYFVKYIYIIYYFVYRSYWFIILYDFVVVLSHCLTVCLSVGFAVLNFLHFLNVSVSVSVFPFFLSVIYNKH